MGAMEQKKSAAKRLFWLQFNFNLSLELYNSYTILVVVNYNWNFFYGERCGIEVWFLILSSFLQNSNNNNRNEQKYLKCK